MTQGKLDSVVLDGKYFHTPKDDIRYDWCKGWLNGKITEIKLQLYYVRFTHALCSDTIRFDTKDEEESFVADVNNDELDLEFLEKYPKPISVIDSSEMSRDSFKSLYKYAVYQAPMIYNSKHIIITEITK